jgi:two-component system response regulator
MDDSLDILLIEDNIFDAELTIRALKQNNIAKNIVHVATGKLALDFFNGIGDFKDRDITNKPKVILLDLKLGHVSGVSVLEKIKDDENTCNIPVVILSGSKEDVDLKRCYVLGANSYLVKPIEFSSFTKGILIPLLSKEAKTH